MTKILKETCQLCGKSVPEGALSAVGADSNGGAMWCTGCRNDAEREALEELRGSGLSGQDHQLAVLRAAIRAKLPIQFRYVKPRKQPGLRIGNPHAVYVKNKSDGEAEIYLDLLQISGVTDSGALPGWRKFLVNCLAEAEILPGSVPFQVDPGYVSTSYDCPIVKV